MCIVIYCNDQLSFYQQITAEKKGYLYSNTEHHARKCYHDNNIDDISCYCRTDIFCLKFVLLCLSSLWFKLLTVETIRLMEVKDTVTPMGRMVIAFLVKLAFDMNINYENDL